MHITQVKLHSTTKTLQHKAYCTIATLLQSDSHLLGKSSPCQSFNFSLLLVFNKLFYFDAIYFH